MTEPPSDGNAVRRIRKQTQERKSALSRHIFKFLFLEVTFALAAEGRQFIANHVPQVPSRRQDEHTARFHLVVLPQVGIHIPRYTPRLFINGRPPDNINILQTLRVCTPEIMARQPDCLPCQKSIRHIHDTGRTAIAVHHVEREHIAKPTTIFGDTSRMCKLEAVNRLFAITDHKVRTIFAQLGNQILLCPVQILILINEYMAIARTDVRVVTQETQQRRNDLPQKHRLVEFEPAHQRLVEFPLVLCLGPSRFLVLQLGPRGFECPDGSPLFRLIVRFSGELPGQVREKRIEFEIEEGARGAARQLHSLPTL